MTEKLRRAFDVKFKEMVAYAESMLIEVGDESPATHGVDPEFNIDEFIKELEAL